MPRSNLITTNFTSGEISPVARGRVDLEQYDAAAEELTNVQVLTAGGAAKRSGSTYISTVKDSAARTVVRPFIASSIAAYVMEIGNLYTRFYRNRGQLLAGSDPLELVTPWTTAELRQLRFSQSIDVLFVYHVNHQTRKISRTAADTFEIALHEFQDGPYAEPNTGDVGAAAGSPGSSGAETGTGGPTAGGDTGGGGPPEGQVGGEHEGGGGNEEGGGGEPGAGGGGGAP